MCEVQWIKLYIDMFDKRKIKKVRRLPAGNDLLLIWIMLLAMAGKCNAGGHIFITENVPFSEEDLADELDFEVNTIRLALKAFEELNMIATTPEGFINILGWEEYQNADKLAEIRAKDRERKRLKRAQTKALLGDSTDVHGHSTDCPRIEEEREKDKEKEFHSFSLSQGEQENSVTNSDSKKRELMSGTLGGGVVMLSDEERSRLLDELSLDEFNHYVGVIRDCEQKGQKFKRKTHYQAIMEMATADRMKAAKPKQTRPKASPKSVGGTFDTDEFYKANLRRTFGESVGD